MALSPHRVPVARRVRVAASVMAGAVAFLAGLVVLPATAGPAFADPAGSPSPRVSPPAPVASPTGTGADSGAANGASSSKLPGYGVDVTADDIELSPVYWQAGGAEGSLLITVRNTGDVFEEIQGGYILPADVFIVTVTAVDGCAPAGSLAFICRLDVGRSGRLTARVSINADAWRHAPLTGNVAASVGGSGDGDGYSILLPTGPPAANLALSATNVALPTTPTNRSDSLNLSVRYTNTGKVAATGAVEIITPAGTDLKRFPPACTSHRQMTGTRDRCELGKVDPGQEVTLDFGLLVTPQAVAEAPLSGVVYASLAANADPTTVEAAYRLIPSRRIGTTESPAPQTTPAAGGGGAGGGEASSPAAETFASRQLSARDIIGTMVAAIVVVAALIFMSLRRRMRDEVEPLGPTDDPEPSGSAG